MLTFSPPFSGSVPIYIALGALVVSLALLIGFVWRRVHRLIRSLRGRPAATVGVIRSTVRLLLILLVVACSGATLMLFAFLQSYTAFTHREQVATVYCTPVPGTKKEMDLKLVIVDTPSAGHIRQYRLFGEQWAIEGHILKWEDWLNFLGLQTIYKLTRVRGRYVRAEDEVGRPVSAYSLIPSEEDPKWFWLYRFGELLPFVNAVYGNTVFNLPSPTKGFEIYVTTSGFMTKEKKEE